jgi:hypothetical protein
LIVSIDLLEVSEVYRPSSKPKVEVLGLPHDLISVHQLVISILRCKIKVLPDILDAPSHLSCRIGA